MGVGAQTVTTLRQGQIELEAAPKPLARLQIDGSFPQALGGGGKQLILVFAQDIEHHCNL